MTKILNIVASNFKQAKEECNKKKSSQKQH